MVVKVVIKPKVEMATMEPMAVTVVIATTVAIATIPTIFTITIKTQSAIVILSTLLDTMLMSHPTQTQISSSDTLPHPSPQNLSRS